MVLYRKRCLPTGEPCLSKKGPKGAWRSPEMAIHVLGSNHRDLSNLRTCKADPVCWLCWLSSLTPGHRYTTFHVHLTVVQPLSLQRATSEFDMATMKNTKYGSQRRAKPAYML